MTTKQIDLYRAYEKATGLLELAKGYGLSPDAIARQEAHCSELKRQLSDSLHTHTINGVKFIVEADGGEWFWTNDEDESTGFASQPVALASAMAWVKGREQIEPELEDNYRAETTASFDRRDYA